MGVEIQTIKDIKLYLASELNELYPETEISAIAVIIIDTITGLTRLHQIHEAGKIITVRQAERVKGICEELKTGKPIQYIIGETSFYNCRIKVNSSVLIPRQETEELVDLIIRENAGFKGTILDIGTGTGCIAIALALNLQGSIVTGTDISPVAVVLSRENASLNNADVTFQENNILSNNPDIGASADIIVSNPPYIRNSEKPFMHRNVIDFEPHLALFVDDSDPLLYYKAILEHTDKILTPGGKVYFEINEALGKVMTSLVESYGFSRVEIVCDLNGRERVADFRRPLFLTEFMAITSA
jgi:release factor glutamine methyltransferase